MAELERGEIAHMSPGEPPISKSKPGLRDQVRLPDDLVAPAAGAIADRPSRILLTGATGYLGAYLLAALLEQSDATIVCLVRASQAKAGLERIAGNLAVYGLQADLGRVEVVCGALDTTDLGLGQAQWTKLAADIDAIVDAAANVNFLAPLDQLLPINVGGPLNLLRLAGATRPKPLHLSSSYSVFNEASYKGVTLAEEDALQGEGEGFVGGYPASKWIAECVGDAARDRGWNVTTHRLGYLWGDTRSGRSKPDDVVTLNVRACLAMGKAQDVDFLIHITPVDFTAAAMAQIVLNTAHSNGHYHLVTETPVTWRALVDGIRENGHAMEMVPFKDWHGALRGVLAANREFMPLALGASLDPERGAKANIQTMQFDASRLRGVLAPSGITCPLLDRQLIGTYVNAMIRQNAR
ncbi:MAG: thioester reductase domain-containing protein [Caulobacter sp.]